MPRVLKGEKMVVIDGDYQNYTGWYNVSPHNKPVKPHKVRVILTDPTGGTTFTATLNLNKTRLADAPPPTSFQRAIFHEHEDIAQSFRASIRKALECGQYDFDEEMAAALWDIWKEERAIYVGKGKKAKHRKMDYKKTSKRKAHNANNMEDDTITAWEGGRVPSQGQEAGCIAKDMNKM